MEQWKMAEFRILYYCGMIARLVWAPLYKNFVKSFFNSLAVVRQAKLYSEGLCYFYGGLIRSNIQIVLPW